MADSLEPVDDLDDDDLPDDIGNAEVGDEDALVPEDLSDIVLYTLDWSVQSLLERIGGTFNINPSFQRRDAWTHERKSRYLESLILGLPVPQIVVAEDGRNKGQFIVLDGKQRLITMKQFADPDGKFSQFRLKELDFLGELSGLSFEEIRSSLLHRQLAENFLSQPVRTIVVRDWKKDAVLYHIFVRLNQSSLSLSPQELRQALFPGSFTHWIDQRSANSRAIQAARGLRAPDFRMRDAEMLLRCLAFTERIEEYSGNLREFLDQMCVIGNTDWSSSEGRYEGLAVTTEKSIEAVLQIFGDDAFRRFEDGKYIRRFNIAVFDVMAYVFQGIDPAWVEANSESLKDEFEKLSVEDRDFQQSLVSTTKSIPATLGRIEKWGRRVESLLGHELEYVSRVDAIIAE